MENEEILLDYKKGSPITIRMRNGEKITGVLRHKPMKYKLKIFGVVIFNPNRTFEGQYAEEQKAEYADRCGNMRDMEITKCRILEIIP
jgi:hypothetical protein